MQRGRQTQADIRLALKAAGFSPVACVGKVPVLSQWQNRANASEKEIAHWSGGNTGVATKDTPSLDIDADHAEAAAAVEAAAREWFDGRGIIPVRFGRAPRRALLFRTSAPFAKIVAGFVAPDGSRHKIEFLGDGQQVVVHGIHPDTHTAYSWHADLCPWNINREDLVEIDEAEARKFLDYVADMLKEQFGFAHTSYGNGHAVDGMAYRPQGGHGDVDARLTSIASGADANDIQSSVIATLLCAGEHPDDVLERVVGATLTAATAHGLTWDRGKEEKAVRDRILAAYKNCNGLLRSYDPTLGNIPPWLPGAFHAAWSRVLAEGRAPMLHFNRYGFCVRAREQRAGKAASDQHAQEFPQSPKTAKEESAEPRKFRFKLVAFGDLRPGPEPLYLVDELIPVAGLVDVWGKAKCFKSFWTLDLMLHVAMGWEYRDRYVRQGAVVYCAFEGAHGYKKRIEALRRHYNIEDGVHVPLYVMPGQANLIAEHRLLIDEIRAQLGEVKPAAVVLDTLNKSLVGSENKDIDMGAYVRAAEAIRDAFGCVVIIIHHCGYDENRPRGHSSLPGAVDAQLAVVRTEDTVTVTVEMMRDGPEDTQVVSGVMVVNVGADVNDKPLTSLVMIPSDAPAAGERRDWPRGLSVFHAALKAALNARGTPFQPEVGVLPVRAVEQLHVRNRFYATYAEAEEDEKKRQGKLRQAFNRALGEAQSRGVAKVFRTDAGQTMIWLPAKGETL